MTDPRIAAALERLDKAGEHVLIYDEPDLATDLSVELAALIRETDKALTNMDQAGGDAQGMPECPWCHQQPDYDEILRHRNECELESARLSLIALCTAIAPEVKP